MESNTKTAPAERPPERLNDPAWGLTLGQRIREVMREAPTLVKDLTVQTGGQGSYRAVSHDQVANGLRPLMARWGINRYIIEANPMPMTYEKKTSRGRRTVNRIFLFATVRYESTDDKDDFRDHPVFADAEDFGDKAPGKVTSYLYKYSDAKFFQLATGEDTDRQPSPPPGGRNWIKNPADDALDKKNPFRADKKYQIAPCPVINGGPHDGQPYYLLQDEHLQWYIDDKRKKASKSGDPFAEQHAHDAEALEYEQTRRMAATEWERENQEQAEYHERMKNESSAAKAATRKKRSSKKRSSNGE